MLKIITGRSGSGKTTKIINEIIMRLNNRQDRKNILLFVPEQMSHQAEYEIAKRVKDKAFSRLQVLSFKRLAYRLFLETGGLNKTFISDITVNMILTKILEENKTKLLLYNKVSANYSFVKLVHDAIKEFKSYDINPDILDNLMVGENFDETLSKKIHDLAIIYRELINVYGSNLLDNEDFYQQLREKIPQSAYLKATDIYIDGYHNFTIVELKTIFEMIKTSENVTLLFTLDNPFAVNMTNEDSLFNLPYKTFNNIRNFALDNNIEIKIEYLSTISRYQNEELAFLEANYDKNNPYPNQVDAIKIYEVEGPESLVHQVARLIFNDVYLNQATYNDYFIYVNNEDLYYPLIKNIFALYDIPVFIDDKKMMLDHFLLNFIDAALECIKTNFSYEAMFRMIKTEIFMPLIYNEEKVNLDNYPRLVKDYRKRIDLLENYCLSHGVLGYEWEKEYWEYDIYRKLSDRNRTKTKNEITLEKIINETKNEITLPLLKFKTAFTNALTVKEQVKAIYAFLMDLDIEIKLDLYEKLNTRKSTLEIDLNEAKKHKQVYNHLIDLFDELVEVCGDFKVNTAEFIKILRTGFKGMKFAIVPPALDQVMVGTLKRSRFELSGHFDDPKQLGVKKALVLGVNENEIPKVQSEKGLLTDKERQLLIEQDLTLSPTIEANLLEEHFIIYTVLTSASTELILTYPLTDIAKKSAYPSEIIEKVKGLFPQLKVKMLYDLPEHTGIDFNYVTTKKMTAKIVLQAINLARKGYEISPMMKALYGYYKHSKLLRPKLIGVTYVNEPAKLTTTDIKLLYGDSITASVSSVESYNHCPYAFFIDRSLQLKPRDIKQLDVMDIGDLYHEVMKAVASKLIENNHALHEMAFSDLKLMVNRIVRTYAEKMKRNFFFTNKQNTYLLTKIEHSLISSLQAMYYQSEHSKFKIVSVEEKFGIDAKRLKVMPIDLSTGMKMNLKGFIDRIDGAVDNNELYLRIVDYKSGNRDIDFTKIYHRLSLQLFTYLDVVLNNSQNLFKQEAKPAGLLYYQIQNSEITADSEIDESKINALHNESYRMNGYTLADNNVSSLFDDKLAAGKNSDIIRVGLKKDDNYNQHSRVLTLYEINALRKYTRKAIKASMEALTSGQIPIKPVMYQNNRHCKFCEFHSICKFDANLRENTYNEIKKTGDNQEIIAKLMDEFGSDQIE